MGEPIKGILCQKQTLCDIFKCKCPQCHEGSIFGKYLQIRSSCPVCKVDLTQHDVGDGPAVFAIFILGFTIVPLALYFYMVYSWSIWVHMILWPALLLGGTMGLLPVLKSALLVLNYHYRLK